MIQIEIWWRTLVTDCVLSDCSDRICDGTDRDMVESSESPLTDCVLSDSSDMICDGTDRNMVESSESPVTDCVPTVGVSTNQNGSLAVWNLFF